MKTGVRGNWGHLRGISSRWDIWGHPVGVKALGSYNGVFGVTPWVIQGSGSLLGVVGGILGVLVFDGIFGVIPWAPGPWDY